MDERQLPVPVPARRDGCPCRRAGSRNGLEPDWRDLFNRQGLSGLYRTKHPHPADERPKGRQGKDKRDDERTAVFRRRRSGHPSLCGNPSGRIERHGCANRPLPPHSQWKRGKSKADKFHRKYRAGIWLLYGLRQPGQCKRSQRTEGIYKRFWHGTDWALEQRNPRMQ